MEIFRIKIVKHLLLKSYFNPLTPQQPLTTPIDE